MRHIARELPLFADHLATFILVFSVFTVWFPIAFPTSWYTTSILFAKELVGSTCAGEYLLAAVLLIGTVSAIVLIVAAPSV